MPDKIIKSSATSDNRIASSLDYIVVRTRVKFDGQCLKQDQITFAHKKIDFMILSEEILWLGSVNLAKKADKDRWKYAGYVIGFDNHGTSWNFFIV